LKYIFEYEIVELNLLTITSLNRAGEEEALGSMEEKYEKNTTQGGEEIKDQKKIDGKRELFIIRHYSKLFKEDYRWKRLRDF
jgi:hypothetical protein